MKKLAVLVSNKGTGSNLRAFIDAIRKKKLKAEIAVVVCDTPESAGIAIAKQHNINTVVCKTNAELLEILYPSSKRSASRSSENKSSPQGRTIFSIDYICLAGWKKIIFSDVIQTFKDKIINVHPGLIPDRKTENIKNPDGTNALWNQGQLTDNAMQKFLESGLAYAGSTIHFVTEDVDFGPVISRGFVKIKKGDTIESLYSRVKKVENKMFVKVLIHLCQNLNGEKSKI